MENQPADRNADSKADRLTLAELDEYLNDRQFRSIDGLDGIAELMDYLRAERDPVFEGTDNTTTK